MGRGDCEGWLYKRKEKDRKLAKNWTKRWCVLKNANMYYYKSKEVGTPGVLVLHQEAQGDKMADLVRGTGIRWQTLLG